MKLFEVHLESCKILWVEARDPERARETALAWEDLPHDTVVEFREIDGGN